jgi:hypothetical protein
MIDARERVRRCGTADTEFFAWLQKLFEDRPAGHVRMRFFMQKDVQ